MSKGKEGAATAVPSTPEEAEQLLAQITDPNDAARLMELSEQRGQHWRVIKLRAERRYGELLGLAEHGGDRRSGSSDKLSLDQKDRQARRRARQVAAVSAELFEKYLADTESPTREGLLRLAGPKTRRRRQGGEQTVKTSDKRPVFHDPEVLNWVRRQTRAGLQTREIVDFSHTAEDWPLPGTPLSDGTLTSCKCAIYHLEDQGARWPLRPGGTAFSRDRRVGKRLHEVGTNRAAARRSGDPVLLWSTAYDITKLTGLLQSLNIEDVDLDEYGLDVLNDLHEDMLYLQDWMNVTLFAVQARLGEQELRKKIAALRSKTVANGCTVDEEAAARRMAARLERRLAATIAA